MQPRLFLDAFVHLLYPELCAGCHGALDEQEALVCQNCLEALPMTRYWEIPENMVERSFWGKLNVQAACSFLFFTKGGIVQNMLHQLKYKGKTDVGVLLGELFGQRLKATSYAEVEFIVPLPLHEDKFKARGYNQCTFIAEGIGKILNKPVREDLVRRVKSNESQTRKGRFARWENVKDLFEVVDTSGFRHQHVLLIDDVVTTGSTLEACAKAILAVEGAKVSLATIACPSPI